MKNRSRMEYSIINSGISAIVYVLNVVVKFVSRSFFIAFLGASYLGLNGLFTNVLSMLSLAELGIGTSIVYSLYAPLANKNKQKIVSLMHLYKKIYSYIGLAVAILGILLIPFLPHIIGDASEIPNILFIYLLFLANSVSSYFFTYNRSLLIADQKVYLTVINDFAFTVISIIAQIVSLYMFNNFILYLIIQIVGTLLGNISLTLVVKKYYPFLKSTNIVTLDEETKVILKKNTIGNLSSKVGSVVVSGTDNIFISSFVGISTVGLYSNYLLIINSVRGLCGQITNSITSSIGNAVIDANDELNKRIFKRHNFVNFTLIYFSSSVLITTMNLFIVFWVGESYLLSQETIFLIICNFILLMSRNSSLVFIEAFGLAWQQRWKSILEALINIILSFSFLYFFKLGINGVLLATTISSLTTVCWIEPYVVYKFGLHDKVSSYLKLISKQLFVLLCNLIIVRVLLSDRFSPNLMGLFSSTMLTIFISLIIYSIFYIRSSEMKFFLELVLKVIRKRK